MLFQPIICFSPFGKPFRRPLPVHRRPYGAAGWPRIFYRFALSKQLEPNRRVDDKRVFHFTGSTTQPNAVTWLPGIRHLNRSATVGSTVLWHFRGMTITQYRGPSINRKSHKSPIKRNTKAKLTFEEPDTDKYRWNQQKLNQKPQIF